MSSGRVGVVVIGRNEGPRLGAALSTARAKAAWVVYVDSGSTDDSVAIAESHDARVVHLDMARPFTAARARNAGVAALRQCAPSLEFVQVMDGDCALIEGWIDAAVAAMDVDTRTVAVCGRRRERFPDHSVYNRLCDQEWNTPVGDAESCGGDALLRLSALDSVGGYDATVIAGEEPELCFRLRRKGGRIVRLDRDMTWHDAAMTRFGQWWRRAVRNGHAVAEGAWRHGAGAERFRRKALRSILLWGLLVPLIILAAAWPTWGASLLASVAYGWLYARVRRYRRGRGDPPADAALYARFCVLGKFPETLGALRFHVNRILGRRPKIIEYKTPAVVERLVAAPAPDAPAVSVASPPPSSPCVLYVGGMLPCRSETFVYRELLALRERGVNVRAASVHPPERGLGDEVLDALARDALPVYGPGPFRLLADAVGAVVRRPWRGAGVVVTIGLDTLFGRDVPFRRRPRVLWQGLAGLALGRRAANTGVAHVHAHMAHVPATIAMYAARYLGATFSFTGHAVDLFCHRTLLRAKLRRAAFAPCISHWHRTFYRTIVDRPDAEFPVVRCGVDPAAFRPGPRLATGAAPRLLAVGRLVPKKGFDVLLRALAMLADEGVPFEARLVGDGPQQEELELLHERLGLGDRVELTGAADNDAVRDAMAATAFFVLPCRVDRRGDRDGIPVVLMEAMACEACVVSGDLATIRELVQPDETGVLVEPDDPEGLADALRLLMEDPARRRRLARAGRRRVEAEFAIAVNADRLLTALTAVNPRLTPRADAADRPNRRKGRVSTMQAQPHQPKTQDPRPRPVAGPPGRRYLLITPCRNEADYLQTTIDAVAAQTVPPAKWIVVDDGSTDATPAILAAAAKRMPYLEVMARPDRGARSVGPGVIEAFYAGLEHADLDDYDYVCKFDADLDLPPRYFERLMEHCEEDPWLGTVSGKLFLRYGERLVEERCGDENSVGPTKFYRTDCFRDIGGFVRQVSWDGIDGHCCRMKGWVARSIDEPDLQIIHLRRMGSSHKSFWTGRLRWGRGKYFMGSRFSYVLAVSAYRMFERPWVLSGLGILCGYLQACAQRPARHDDPTYLRWLRRYELESLFRGKRRTMRRWHEHVRQTFPARPVAPATPRERAA